MKRQLAKVFHNGTYRVIWDSEKEHNKYRLTFNGKKVDDYANLESCLYRICDLIYNG